MKDKLNRWALSTLVAVAASLVFTLFFGTYSGWLGLLSVVVMTAAFSIGFNYLADRHDERLTARVKADEPVMWNVCVNGVEVGKVSDSQYAALQRMAFCDGRLALAQFFNLGRMALVVVEKLLIAVPLLVFWAAVALAIFSPESYTETVREFQKADPAAITSAARSLLQLTLTVMFLAVGGMVMMGYRFGFRNHYSEAVNRMLRQQCNTPADGDVHLWRMATDAAPGQLGPVTNDR